MTEEKTAPKKPMVGWYDPRQLINTAIQVLASDLIGTRFDARREEALAAKQDELPFYDYSAHEGDFWFDYMADTGDGWDATFGMAKLVSGAVSVEGHDPLPRGEFLVLGGDQIYPFASKQEYQDRLIGPLNAAAKRAGEMQSDLYAIPGNHDWYDGLISFLRLFTQGRRIGDWEAPDKRMVGGWRTKQSRSYFALKLPQNWWLWAVDTQLEADLDQPQVEYFRRVVEKMERGDRLIVCIPEPDWLYGKMLNDENLMNNMAFLLTHVIRGEKKGNNVKVYLTLSGDLHHYRRHQHRKDSTQQKIVAGGGGAFLHPTHKHNVRSVTVFGEDFELQADSQFPDESTSFWLTFYNLLFPWLNPWFGTLTAPAYLFFGWSLTGVRWGLRPLFELTASQPTIMLTLAAVALVGFYYFSVGTRTFRLLWGTLVHGGAHTAAVLLLADLMTRWFGGDLTDWQTALPRLAGLLVGGYLLGPLIMGLYLLTSLNVFGTHHNEAFSALRIKHYKNFLRMCVRADGALDIYPVGVPDLHARPILIEGPITIKPPC